MSQRRDGDFLTRNVYPFLDEDRNQNSSTSDMITNIRSIETKMVALKSNYETITNDLRTILESLEFRR